MTLNRASIPEAGFYYGGGMAVAVLYAELGATNTMIAVTALVIVGGAAVIDHAVRRSRRGVDA